jgi:glycosyltransferase involved in cell wall biosynthesis
LKIGILGTRGIPNRYGGFEQCAEKLALGLVGRGHDVSVYNSSRHEYKASEWNGVHIIHCFDPEGKLGTAGQFIYDLNCINDARRRKFDVLLQLGYTSNSVWWWRWPSCPNVVNMDGLEWKRSKYSPRVQRFLRKAEAWAAKHGDVLVADSTGIQEHLQDAYNRPSTFIPYGAELFSEPEAARLEDYGVEPYSYHLLIARMEPENNIETVLQGFLKSTSGDPLLVVGGLGNAYGKELAARYGGEARVRFLGAIYDATVINNLRYFSHLYFHGHSVGGTNPSLLEAMACSALIAAHDNVFNRAVLEEEAFYFTDAERLARVIDGVRAKREYPEMLSANRHRIVERYNWPRIVEEYEAVLQTALESSDKRLRL